MAKLNLGQTVHFYLTPSYDPYVGIITKVINDDLVDLSICVGGKWFSRNRVAILGGEILKDSDMVTHTEFCVIP